MPRTIQVAEELAHMLNDGFLAEFTEGYDVHVVTKEEQIRLLFNDIVGDTQASISELLASSCLKIHGTKEGWADKTDPDARIVQITRKATERSDAATFNVPKEWLPELLLMQPHTGTDD